MRKSSEFNLLIAISGDKVSKASAENVKVNVIAMDTLTHAEESKAKNSPRKNTENPPYIK